MPKVCDVDKRTGKRYSRFRMDVRISRERYEMFKRLCKSLHITPSAKVRELINQWMEKHSGNADLNDKWKLFIEKMKAEGFETPEEWIKARLGI